MDVETLLTGSRWAILETIAQQPSSPLEISKVIGTTMANVSSQLRLLEAAGIVHKTRTKSSEAGKPRVIYELKQNQFFMARLAPGNITKTLHQQSLLDYTLASIATLPLENKHGVYAYVLKHFKQLSKHSFGFTLTNNSIVVGVVGEHSLPTAQHKEGSQTLRITPRKVTSLDGFDIQIVTQQ